MLLEGIRWGTREACQLCLYSGFFLALATFYVSSSLKSAYKSGGRSRNRDKLQDRLVLCFRSWGRFSASFGFRISGSATPASKGRGRFLRWHMRSVFLGDGIQIDIVRMMTA